MTKYKISNNGDKNAMKETQKIYNSSKVKSENFLAMQFITSGLNFKSIKKCQKCCHVCLFTIIYNTYNIFDIYAKKETVRDRLYEKIIVVS